MLTVVALQEEAVEGRRRLTEDKDALLVELRGTGIEPPYSHAHVTETAIHREIMRIYQFARPETRMIYDLGRDVDRVEEENWVIRWMLWHVFRYRDNRNRNRRGVTSNGNSPDDDDGDTDSSPVPVARKPAPCRFRHSLTLDARWLTLLSATGTSRYWDPVRNG